MTIVGDDVAHYVYAINALTRLDAIPFVPGDGVLGDGDHGITADTGEVYAIFVVVGDDIVLNADRDVLGALKTTATIADVVNVYTFIVVLGDGVPGNGYGTGALSLAAYLVDVDSIVLDPLTTVALIVLVGPGTNIVVENVEYAVSPRNVDTITATRAILDKRPLLLLTGDGVFLYNVRMSTQEVPIVSFLREVMRRRKRLLSQLAADLGVSHVTVSRWLNDKDVPNIRSCQKLAAYSGVPVEKVLSIAGHLPRIPEKARTEWPEFRDYARQMYPDELDEDLITMIEDLIERRRRKRYGSKDSKMGS